MLSVVRWPKWIQSGVRVEPCNCMSGQLSTSVLFPGTGPLEHDGTIQDSYRRAQKGGREGGGGQLAYIQKSTTVEF